VNVIEAEEKPSAFQKKLPLWRRRTEKNNFVNFPRLEECVSGIEDDSEVGGTAIPRELKHAIATHLDELAKPFDGYFLDQAQHPAWVRQPFTFGVAMADVNDQYLDDLIELQQSQIQQLFGTTTLSAFWCCQMEGYPLIAKIAHEILTPFVTRYLCEHAFSKLLDIKTKKRSRLACESDMRVALAKTKPRISQIASKKTRTKIALRSNSSYYTNILLNFDAIFFSFLY